MILHILANIILPIFVLIGVGVLIDRAFKPDLPTLSKLNFYVFVPALVFVRLIDSQLNAELIGLDLGYVQDIVDKLQQILSTGAYDANPLGLLRW